MYDYTPMKKRHALQPRKDAKHDIDAALSNNSSHTLAAHWQGMLKRCFDHARGADNISQALTRAHYATEATDKHRQAKIVERQAVRGIGHPPEPVILWPNDTELAR